MQLLFIIGVELGVAETNVMKAIAQATGRALDRIKADAATLGDLGLVAENSRSSQKTLFQPQPLTVPGVFGKLKEIAAMTGQAVSKYITFTYLHICTLCLQHSFQHVFLQIKLKILLILVSSKKN